ncbi:hypothetical protein PoB_005757500 [Plakobranchus ocellatus]|uniref:Uncharacterized protein n=1 Tax=Plakobranchus ocellatus TaxID=259542 RepID=A0AAV4CH25_9GAST|nr:hypothetical protein PoB_005757500 [Plakobranchus ocellatus]
MHQLSKRRHICSRRFFTQKSMNIYGTDLNYLDNAIDQQQRLDPADETSKTKAWYKATAKRRSSGRSSDVKRFFLLTQDEVLNRRIHDGQDEPERQGMKVIPRTAERKVRGADFECRSGGGTEDRESALKFAETILSRDRAPSPALWPEGRPESLKSPFLLKTKTIH